MKIKLRPGQRPLVDNWIQVENNLRGAYANPIDRMTGANFCGGGRAQPATPIQFAGTRCYEALARRRPYSKETRQSAVVTRAKRWASFTSTKF